MGVEKRSFCCFACRSVVIFRMVGVACVVLRAVRLICWMVRSLSVVFHRLFSMRYDSSAPLQGAGMLHLRELQVLR